MAGAIFIGVGTGVLYENLDLAASQLSHLFGASGNTLGTFPTVMLAALRVLQAYAFDQQRFAEALLRQLLVTLWPLLLVIAGTALSRDASPANLDIITKKDGELVDLTTRRSTLQ